MAWRLDIAVQTPAHAALGDLLSYASAVPLVPGTLVRVPLGRREVLGVVWNDPASLDGAEPDMALKPVGAALDALAPLGDAWRDLVAFAARYSSARSVKSLSQPCRRSCATSARHNLRAA